MRLAGAGDEELVGLRIAEEADQQVLFHELVDGGRELVFVGAALGLDGVGHGRLGQGDEIDLRCPRPCAPSVSPVRVSRSLATAPRSPACSSGTSTALRPCMTLRWEKPLLAAARVVLDGGVVLDDAADDLEEADAAGEGIGHGLEDDQASGLAVVHLAQTSGDWPAPAARRFAIAGGHGMQAGARTATGARSTGAGA